MEFSIVDVIQNLSRNREKRASLTLSEEGLLLEYICYWNNHGRKNNKISPRNTAIFNLHPISNGSFYRYRGHLKELGFIKVNEQDFIPNKKNKGRGKQAPTVIELADWLVASNKITCNNEVIEKEADTTDTIESKSNSKPISVAALDKYGKDLVAQIGATGSVYPRLIENIKNYETKLSNEVIKSVRNFVYTEGIDNPLKYYKTIIKDLNRQKITNLIDLENYNPDIVGKSPIVKFSKEGRNAKQNKAGNIKHNNYYRNCRNNKRVEKGTDWSKKEVPKLSDEELNNRARDCLGLSANEPWPSDYENLSPQERFSKSFNNFFTK